MIRATIIGQYTKILNGSSNGKNAIFCDWEGSVLSVNDKEIIPGIGKEWTIWLVASQRFSPIQASSFQMM